MALRGEDGNARVCAGLHWRHSLDDGDQIGQEWRSAFLTTTFVKSTRVTRVFAPRVFGENRRSWSKNHDTDHESAVQPCEPLGHSKRVLQMAPDDGKSEVELDRRAQRARSRLLGSLAIWVFKTRSKFLLLGGR